MLVHHALEHRRIFASSEAAIVAYVKREQPLDCAGSYKVEGLGIALFSKMEGTDFTGIIGLPLTKVVALLERFGVEALTAAPCAPGPLAPGSAAS